MKLNGFLAAFAVAVVMISTSSASAADGVLGKFFGDKELTLGNMSFASRYATSDVNGLYGECAGCAANAAADAPIVDGFAYDYGYVEPSYFVDDFGYVAYDEFWAPRRAFTPVRRAFRPVANVLRGVRDFFCRSYNYCQPAYVCDPCWSVCDPCWSPCVDACDPCGLACAAPCAPLCDPCAPLSVYAPAGCCGDGFAPGETRPLNSQTGLAELNRGIDDAGAANDEPTKRVLKTDDEQAPAAQPSIPSSPTFQDPNATLLNENPEPIAAPPADKTGAGVIRMLVPEDSVVFINGYRTKQKGALRSFAANNLEYGESYTFEIRVVEVRDGKRYEDVQSTTLTAGDTTALAFNPTLRSDEAYALNAR